MNKQIVALSINKVQSFLFDTILAHTQEKQAETTTLKSIMTASQEISVDFAKKIKEAFSNTQMEELLYCSGVFIFQCKLEEDFIDKNLNDLFLEYYRESQGTKQLRYVYFPIENLSKLEAITKAKQMLQKPESLAAIVAKNKNTLFSFKPVEYNIEGNKLNENDIPQFPKFAETINKLYNPIESDNSNHFRMAVIKADLDGMGDLFKNIDDYENYKIISEILNEFVSLEGLHKVALKYFPKISNNEKGWIFPFYVAGDDIFIAVSISNLITGIDVCRNMINEINHAIKNKTRLASPKYKLSLSIGVEIVFNREPVRYYLNMVEKQLKCAKSIKPNESIKQFVHSKISISGVVWLDIDNEKIKFYKKELKAKTGKKHNIGCKCNACKNVNAINRAVGSAPIWQFLLDEVAILNFAKASPKLKEDIGTSHFFYTLLEKLTDTNICCDNIKYVNHLLYHLLPKYMDTPIKGNLWKVELLINRGIIKQLYQKGFYGNRMQINDDTKEQLKVYLQLMLLFSDTRFQMNGIVSKGYNFKQDAQENVGKELLNKPMEYLYELLDREHGSDLLKFFADYKKLGKDGNHLERLSVDKSMFYKLRKTDKVDITKAASMIELHNSATSDEIKEKNAIRVQEGKKPQYIYFDKEEFCETAKSSGQWTEDFIDSLMLLYEYNSFLRIYKKRCKDLRGGLANER